MTRHSTHPPTFIFTSDCDRKRHARCKTAQSDNIAHDDRHKQYQELRRQARSEESTDYYLHDYQKKNNKVRAFRNLRVASKKDKSKARVALKCGINSFDDTSVDLHYCGPLDHVCQHCGALGFVGENKATKKN
jgi:hypothetical protein